MQSYSTKLEDEDNVDKSLTPVVIVQEAGPAFPTNEYGDEIDQSYKTQSTFDRFRRGVFLQMILFGA